LSRQEFQGIADREALSMFGGEQSVSHVTGGKRHGPTDSVSTIWPLVSNVSSWPIFADVIRLNRYNRPDAPFNSVEFETC
jgi:hypothetical protein